MDYAELFERQGEVMDELLVHAFAVTEEQYRAPGPEGAPSLRELVAEWLETQRRAVHEGLQERPYHALPPAATATVPELAKAFGGFRLTLREVLEEVTSTDLSREVTWTAPGGKALTVTLDEVLAHLILHGARMTGLVAQRLRQLGREPPGVDLLA
jgi:uncharacterized damage-inducible protein DinB